MTTISTYQTIGLTSTTYAVHTDTGQHLGTYQQDHGADTVTSADLPAEDDGIVGPIEAIAAFARVAGIKGWMLVRTHCVLSDRAS